MQPREASSGRRDGEIRASFPRCRFPWPSRSRPAQLQQSVARVAFEFVPATASGNYNVRGFFARHPQRSRPEVPMKPSVRLLLVLALLASGAALAQGVPDTLSKIKAAKSITIAFSADSFPFSYVETNNQPAGYSIDLCKRVVAALGRVTGAGDLKINWVVDTVPNRVTLVAGGKADMECANTTQSQARLQQVDFSNLIFVDGGGFLVRADSDINSFGDLAGKSIAVTSGTTTEKRLGQMLQTRLINAKVVQVKDGVEGVAMLESGGVDAFASDKIKLIGLAAQAKNPKAFALLSEDL